MSYSTARRQAMLQRSVATKSFFLLFIILAVLSSFNTHAAWEKQTGLTGKSIRSIAVDPIDSNKIFAGTDYILNAPTTMGLYKSSGTTTQKTWAQVTGSSLPGHVIRSISIAPDSTFNNQKMFIVVAPQASSQNFSSLGGIYKSIDGGITFTPTQIASPSNPGLFLTSGVSQVVISKRVNNIQNVYAVVDTDEYGGQGAGLYVSSNDGLSWIKRNGVTDIQQIVVAPSEPNTVFISTKTTKELKRSTDGGATFLPANSGLPTGMDAIIIDFSVDPVNANNIYASAYQFGVEGFYYSLNKGQSWTRTSTDVFYKVAVASVFNTNKIYGVKNEAISGVPRFNVFMSQNNGTSWTKVDQDSTGFTVQRINALTVSNDTIYVAADDGLYIHAEGGAATTNPLANNGSLIVPAGSTSANGVLTGTRISPNDTLTYRVVTNGSKGSMVITSPTTGAFTYTPFANQTGTDTVTFSVTDQLNRTSLLPGSITISLQSNSVSTNPVATNSTVAVTAGTSSVNGFLSAQKVAFTDTLTYAVVTNGAKGFLTITNPSTGAFTYTANAGQTGTDTVLFRVTDQLQRSSLVNGIVTINLSGSGTGVGTGTGAGAVDLNITATATPLTIQAGSDLTYALKVSNLSTTSNSGIVTITSSQLPALASLVPGSYDTCVLRSNRVLTCTVSSLRRQSTLNIQVIVKMPVSLTGASVNTTFTVSTPGEPNITNNSAQVVTTIGTGTGTGTGTGAGTGIGTGVGGTIPVARSTSLVASSGATVFGEFQIQSKVSATDTLRYIVISNGTLGTLRFTSPAVGTPNISSSPSFSYTANAGVVGNDTINFRVIDNFNRESAIKSVIISVQSPNTSPGNSSSSGGASGGAFNPLLLILGLLPLLLRRKNK